MTPDAHRRDPAGYLLTQAGHFGAVGAALSWVVAALAGPVAALATMAVGYALLEAAQARHGAQTVRDAAEDWGFVMLGAAWVNCILMGIEAGAWAALSAAAALVVAGVRRRV